MLTVLTGTGLSAAAGINAYIPLLLVGLVARFTDLLPIGAGWQWLEHPVTLVALTVLLCVEFLADKFPVVDSVNDVVQTVVRPTSGGITFGAGASSVTLEEVATLGEAASGDGSLWPIVSGVVIAFALHIVKSLARPLINAVTAGVGGAVTSIAEDVSSLVLAALAILIPIVVLLFVPAFVFLVVWLVRTRRRRKRAKATQREGAGTAPHPWTS
ncbi:DUF4126 domain-containing protein [Halostreptopolyspora alba]|uniref:DUF4126 domain-containing protein n=1 Tax=Halostreptopolyspora alba TaxID=2487137 RepID=A0A3N0DYQ9_9ACTN|nr:DUF4126 domain-containing protein [Nocardiopsaceae bacterium YIM 96095]